MPGRDSSGKFVKGGGGSSKVSVKDVDLGYKELIKKIYGDKSHKISVGIFASAAEVAKQERNEEGEIVSSPTETLLDVAVKNEFGIGVPERSFVRDWVDLNRPNMVQWMKRLLAHAYVGNITGEVALERMGLKMVGSMQKRISDGIEPPNSPAIIAKKGSSKPLIDTGQLRSSITYKVEK